MIAASSDTQWSIVAHGDRCLVIRFGNEIDVQVGRRCGAAAAALRLAALPGVSDIVPTFNSVAVHFLPANFPSGQGAVQLQARILQVLGHAGLEGTPTTGRSIELPVCYGGEFGPDLPEVASRIGLSEAEVIRVHAGEPVYVFMLGFAPGAPFMGLHDERFALPRRDTPRTAVPAGSVAIANRQTIVYPNELPGGWHIIGRTPLCLFDATRHPSVLIAPGDNVRFTPITAAAFHDWPRP